MALVSPLVIEGRGLGVWDSTDQYLKKYHEPLEEPEALAVRNEIARPAGDGADTAIRNHRTCGDRFWTRLMTGAIANPKMICKVLRLVWSVLAVPVEFMGLSEPVEPVRL